jgi:putative hydrolase of the HAD superfamily
MTYQAVFFDAGETLLAPHPSFAEVFAAVMRDSGHIMEARQVEKAFEDISPSFVEILDRSGASTWSTSRELSMRFWRVVYQTAFENLGIEDSDGTLAEALYERFTRYESYRLFPDALPALRRIKAAEITVGLISNFEEWLEEMLVEWQVAPLFDLMVISGKEGVEKPDPAIFRRALELAKVKPSSAMYVGDHPQIDAEAAEAVGMKGVLIDRRARYPEFQGQRISTLDELLPLLGIEREGKIATQL